jgi:hypothetical protein
MDRMNFHMTLELSLLKLNNLRVMTLDASDLLLARAALGV